MVSTTMSCFGWPTIWRTWALAQSRKYCAEAVAEVLCATAGWARAWACWAAVMAPVSCMASSTRRARSADFSGSSTGL